MTTITTLLDKARRAISASDASLHQAADHIAAARAQGASQARIARHLGRSPAWVSILLRWRRDGFKGAPFAPQSHAARKAAQARRTLERSRSVNGASPIAHSGGVHSECTPDKIARAEVQRAQFDFQRERAQAVTAMFGATIDTNLRAQLVMLLASLPTGHPIERVRARLGMSWNELLVPAAAESVKGKAA
jgi:DNA-binding CsgD family transcriptional regulator